MNQIALLYKLELPAVIAGAGKHAGQRFFEFFTAYLLNGGTIENAKAIAAHESPRTTKLYDRTADDTTLDEVERIGT